MTVFDGVLTIATLLLFAGFLSLVYERQNGHIGTAVPEPTVLRQLEQCGYQLKTALQTVEFLRKNAEIYKSKIDELAKALENCEQTNG